MNILQPYQVCNAVKARLIESISEFTYEGKEFNANSIADISSIPTQGKYGLKPPWMGLYYNYDDDGQVAASGHSLRVPVTIGVLCASTPGKKTDNDAVREAVYYARKTIMPVVGEYEINIGTEEEPQIILVYLEAKPQPLKIVPNPTAELALVTSWFQYFETH